MYTAVTRIIVSIVLYVIVWHHAHWSVALCITLIGLTVEAQLTYTQAARHAARKAQRESERLAKNL
jgi:hypothetical protein